MAALRDYILHDIVNNSGETLRHVQLCRLHPELAETEEESHVADGRNKVSRQRFWKILNAVRHEQPVERSETEPEGGKRTLANAATRHETDISFSNHSEVTSFQIVGFSEIRTFILPDFRIVGSSIISLFC